MNKFSALIKLLQRKCYDFLSLQYAFIFILISSFMFIMSIIHFGEAWFDWSRNKYEAVFSSFSDNIIEKSFYKQLCQRVPIDVVYTWVNGSDPLFLKNLKKVTENVEEAMGVNKSFTSRYEDLEELRYSLRSLEMYAPWVHHVFLVTNGQIPYWLDMEHPRLTVVTHEEIFLNLSHLPTFSSPAIESHLHRIPGLSKHFLYFNDDILLGKPIWPEDFLTESEGYKIFVSWNIPECSAACIWSWVGDGSCDPPCNIEECSYDGGDCNSTNKFPKYDYKPVNGPLYYSSMDADLEKEIKFAEEYYQMLNKNVPLNKTGKNHNGTNQSSTLKRKLLTSDFLKSEFVNRSLLDMKNGSSNILNFSYLYNNGIKPINVKKEILGAFKNNDRNLSISDIVESSNKKWMQNNRLIRKTMRNLRKNKRKMKSFPKNYIKLNTSNITYEKFSNKNVKDTHMSYVIRTSNYSKDNSSTNNYHSSSSADTDVKLLFGGRKRVLDMFAESLLFVNRLYNRAFGVNHRKVPAHMPHFINKDIMIELQNRFPKEWNDTSSHKLRSKQDMQFAFSYFYFIVDEKVERDITDIFDEVDTDGSGTWSDREIRTLLTRLYGVPLSYPIILEFEEFITNCSKKYTGPIEEFSTPYYERYSDSKLPTITKSLIKGCPSVIEMLKEQFGSLNKYKYDFVKDNKQDVSFKMITSNLSKVIENLDIIRSRPRKFICLNNNMDSSHDQRENDVVRAVLQDFYQSLYPKKSSFELSNQYRNRFLYVNELRQWRKDHENMNMLLLLIFFAVGTILFICNCQGEIRFVYRKFCGIFMGQDSSRVLINYSNHRTISQI